MSKSLLHDWESSIEKNKNNTEELLKIAEDIYNTAYARGKASTETPKGDLISREALKIEIEKQIAYCDDKSIHQSDMEELLRYSNTSYGLRLAHIYVVNAPTVEYTFEEAFQKTVCEQKLYCPKRPQGEWIRLDMAKRVIAKFEGYLDEDMIERIQIALEKENEAEMKGGKEE